MVEYRFVYKCRLCGGTNENTCIGNESAAMNVLVCASIGNPKPVDKKQDIIHLTEVHQCGNGQMGITDLQGYKKVDTESSLSTTHG